MSESVKTFLYIVIAVGLVFLAYATIPTISEPEVFNDRGELFFPEFQDPTQPAALEVVEFVAQTAEIKPFRVQWANSRWTIPSHYDYPADAQDHMAKAAGLLIGLRKEDIRSDEVAYHALFGVVDPREETAATEGRGKLIRFEDKAGNELAALIIGKEITGRNGQHYLRIPGKKRTYTSTISDALSINFADWIETDLLQMSPADLNGLLFDNYSIDEGSGAKSEGEKISLSKEDNIWKLNDLTNAESFQDQPVAELTTSLDNLKIVGVRPKPDGLSRSLALAEGMKLDMPTLLSLQSRGFYVTRDGQLLANEGDLVATTKKGVRYVLRFGEVIFGAGDEVSAGSKDTEQDNTTRNAGTPDNQQKEEAANRYLMVTANFDVSLIEKPTETPLPDEHLQKRQDAKFEIENILRAIRSYQATHENKFPETLSQLTEGETPLLGELKKDPWTQDYVLRTLENEQFEVLSYAEDGAEGGEGLNADISSLHWEQEQKLQELAAKQKTYAQQMAEGQKEAKILSERFAPWYYVIDNENFKKLHLDRGQLVAPKTQDAAGGTE